MEPHPLLPALQMPAGLRWAINMAPSCGMNESPTANTIPAKPIISSPILMNHLCLIGFFLIYFFGWQNKCYLLGVQNHCSFTDFIEVNWL